MATTEQVKNIAKKTPITAKEAVSIANKQIWQREFNPDYDQIIKRFSNAVGGLQNGGQAPIAS